MNPTGWLGCYLKYGQTLISSYAAIVLPDCSGTKGIGFEIYRTRKGHGMNLVTWFKRIKQLKKQSLPDHIPVHVAIIMDGNGRWAQQRGLPRSAGHHAGMERVRDAVESCLEAGVRYLTLYAFSTENWHRPPEEVNYLMDLFEEAMRDEIPKMHQKGVRVRFIGLKQGLRPTLVKYMEQSEELTSANRNLTLNLAINYGGRSELIAAAKGLMRAAVNGEIKPEELTEAELAKHLFTAGQPDPDLLIKPGREYRISNFLIWQMAYTEFYFSDLYWPDFGKNQMEQAFAEYGRRERRFGGVKEGKKDHE